MKFDPDPGSGSPRTTSVNEARITHALIDRGGVLVKQREAVDGAAKFIGALRDLGVPFMVLTNSSIYTARDLSARFQRAGLDIPEHCIWTSALATARFLQDQRPGGTAFVLGEAGLTTALHEVGYIMVDSDPEYVVLGETRSYSFDALTAAIRMIANGARFIATNPDPSGPSPRGILPATGAVAALITKATGVMPYFVGKPNPIMLRIALNAMDAHSESTLMIGDRMDTDVVCGLEAGIRTVLVLTGSTQASEVGRFQYRPWKVVDSIADLDPYDLFSRRLQSGDRQR